MASKNKGLGLPQTRGIFQVSGKVSGTKKDNFYTEKTTKTNKQWRSTNFAVEFNEGNNVYVDLNGMERDKVFFTKRNEDKSVETKDVPWKDRFTFAEEGFSIIGVNVGVRKVVDSKGNEVNDKKHLVEYDACKEIADNLNDGQSVFIKGNIEYSEYEGKHRTRLAPSQVSLCRDIDFAAEGFQPTANFTQTIVFMSVKPSEDKTYATLAAKIVNYNSIEDAEFIIKDMALARQFSKNLKPYTAMKVWGDIEVHKDITEVEVSDGWGTKNKMDRVNSPETRELVITGADPDTIDTTTYTEEEMDKAIETMKANKAAEKDFGNSSNGGWGSVASSVVDDDEDAGW